MCSIEQKRFKMSLKCTVRRDLTNILWRTQCHCTNLPGTRDGCRTAPDGCRPLDQADELEPYPHL